MKKLILGFLALALSQFAAAQIVLFQANLTGAQENPPVATPATGFASASFDMSTSLLTINETWSGLLSPTADAHIHRGAIGVNGPIIIPFTGFPLGVTSGSYSNTFLLTAPQAADLLAGLYYANIHTTQFRGGEIRGQLLAVPGAVPEPSTYAVVGVALLGVMIGGRLLRQRLSASS